MRDFKNIDRIFQEKLKDFEVYPPNKSWDSIEKQLEPVAKKRRIPIWLKFASIAAILIFFFSAGTIYFLPKSEFLKKFSTNTVIEKESKKAKEVIKKSKAEEQTPNTTTQIPSKKTNNFQEEKFTKNKEIDEITETTLQETSKVTNPSLKNYLLSESSNNKLKSSDKKEKIFEKRAPKFTVATIFAPVYMSSFGDGSSIDSQFKDNPTSGSSSYSYGVKVAYQLTNKFTLQSGVNLVNLGFTTSDIYVTPGVAVLSFSNLSSNPLAARSEQHSLTKGSATNPYEENKGNLNQNFGYIEIPVEVKYNITDGKFGVNVVGGFSTLLLNNDEVLLETNDFSQSLGASNNLRNINFTGNIGVDLDYAIQKNFFINISPMFKIQTNTFSKNAGSIQPYYLGIYTGLNYKF